MIGDLDRKLADNLASAENYDPPFWRSSSARYDEPSGRAAYDDGANWKQETEIDQDEPGKVELHEQRQRQQRTHEVQNGHDLLRKDFWQIPTTRKSLQVFAEIEHGPDKECGANG